MVLHLGAPWRFGGGGGRKGGGAVGRCGCPPAPGHIRGILLWCCILEHHGGLGGGLVSY